MYVDRTFVFSIKVDYRLILALLRFGIFDGVCFSTQMLNLYITFPLSRIYAKYSPIKTSIDSMLVLIMMFNNNNDVCNIIK